MLLKKNSKRAETDRIKLKGCDDLKKNYEQYKKMLRTLLCGILILSQTAVFAYVWLTNYNNDIVLPFVQKGNWLLYTLYAIISITFLRAFDCTKYGRYRKTNIIPSQMLAAFFTAVVTYLQIVLLSAEFVSVIPLIQMFFVDVAIIFVLTVSGDFMFDKIFPAKKVLLLYDNYSPDVFIRKLKSRKDKFVVDEIMNISVGIDELKEAIKDAESVILYDLSAEIRNKLLKICFEYDIRTYSTTKVSDVLVRGAECIHLFDTPLLLYRNIGLTFEQHVIKRAMDIVIASIMLVLSSPFLLISAIAIKLYDGGPVFFTQARYTLNGKVFKIHKFRSMIVDAEKNGTPIPSTKGDPRITPVGKVLRATRLDELPQLIDILVGNMSLVGPRPERIEHVDQYSEEIPEFRYRLKVRGGLTGYAQLYGKYNTTPYDKLQLDLMYIQNYSLLLDIKLILMTIKIMFTKDSTEGFEEEDSKKITEKSQEQ